MMAQVTRHQRGGQVPNRSVQLISSIQNTILPEPQWYETCRKAGMDPTQFSSCEKAFDAFVDNSNKRRNDKFFAKKIKILNFDGRGDAEQATDFLDSIKAAAIVNRIPLDDITEYVPCFLTGRARRWFGDLSVDIVKSWQNFSLAFTERFGLSESEDMNALMNLVQEETESTFDFVLRFYDQWLQQDGITDIGGLRLLLTKLTTESTNLRILAGSAQGIRDLCKQILKKKTYLKVDRIPTKLKRKMQQIDVIDDQSNHPQKYKGTGNERVRRSSDSESSSSDSDADGK